MCTAAGLVPSLLHWATSSQPCITPPVGSPANKQARIAAAPVRAEMGASPAAVPRLRLPRLLQSKLVMLRCVPDTSLQLSLLGPTDNRHSQQARFHWQVPKSWSACRRTLLAEDCAHLAGAGPSRVLRLAGFR